MDAANALGALNAATDADAKQNRNERCMEFGAAARVALSRVCGGRRAPSNSAIDEFPAHDREVWGLRGDQVLRGFRSEGQ
jgi:hypothetical protein